jgi:hypothetical protein
MILNAKKRNPKHTGTMELAGEFEYLKNFHKASFQQWRERHKIGVAGAVVLSVSVPVSSLVADIVYEGILIDD